MSFAEFGDLTFAELDDFIEEWRQEQDAQNFRFGVLASVFANVHRDSKRKSNPFQPSDFFRPLSTPVPAPVEPDESDESRAVVIDDFWTQVKSITRRKQAKPTK